jgi:alkylation response protein AidB-like acyl-CoA dehydrogenase
VARTVDQLPHATAADADGALDAIVALQPVIRDFQEETERGVRIPPALVERLRTAGLYRMAVPRVLGGLQLDLLLLLRIVELAAEADGSVGWNLINNSTDQLAALGLPDEGVAEIFGDRPDPIIGGTVVPGGGRAREVPGGFVVSGRWRFGSGCQEAQWCVSNFSVWDGDEPRRHADGTPRLWRSFFRRDEVTVHETWRMTGMRGTGSHDWSVEEVFVPARRTLPLPPTPFTNQWQRWAGTLYQLPVQAVLGPHHSVVATGIARAAIDELCALASTKVPRGRTALLRDEFQVQEAVARAEAVLGAGQAYRGQLTAELWDTVAAGQATTLEQRARCRLASVYAVDCARQAMDLMFRAGGTTSNQQGQRLEQCWRDLNVVGQAATLMPEWYPVTGRVLLGLPADPRLG